MMAHSMQAARFTTMLLALLVLAGCASGPRRAPESADSVGARVAGVALAQVGRPYRYGGSGPDSFDCSGLVHFAYASLGIRVPRTTEAQFDAARPVPTRQLARGDLLFFRFDKGPKVSHVAIYTGDGRFVHAPQSGRSVETGRLEDDWYRRRLVAAGRLH
jgi:murein DD-endopeptidase